MSVTTPVVGAGPGWGVILNAALASLDARITALPGAVVRTAPKVANYTAAPGDLVIVDTTTNAVTVTLPSAPADKTNIGIKLILPSPVVFPVTVQASGTDVFNKAGGVTSFTMSIPAQGSNLQYNAAAQIWTVISGDTPLGSLDTRYSGMFPAIPPQPGSAQTLTSTATVVQAGEFVRVTEAAAVTGIILPAGSAALPYLVLINEGAFSITFAASGTSRVADGVSDVVAALTARKFAWDAAQGLWFRLA